MFLQCHFKFKIFIFKYSVYIYVYRYTYTHIFPPGKHNTGHLRIKSYAKVNYYIFHSIFKNQKSSFKMYKRFALILKMMKHTMDKRYDQAIHKTNKKCKECQHHQ